MATEQTIGESVRYLLGLQELVRAPFTPGVGPLFTGAGGSTPTIVIAASNTSYKTQLKADFVSPGPDATETLQVALQELIFNRGGGRLVWTEGDFYLPRTTVLGGGVAYRFEGMGEDNTRLHSQFGPGLSTPSNQTMFEIDHTAGTGIGGVVSFSNMTLDGHKAIQTSGTPHGIYVEPNGTTVISLDHMTIQDFRGIGFFADRSADDVFLDHCRFLGNTSNGIFVFVEGNYYVTNCNISLNTGVGVRADGANLKMVGSVVHGNGSHGFSSGGIFESTPKNLLGNTFTNNAGIGVLWDGVNGSIMGGYVAGNGQYGMHLLGNSPLVVTGNTIVGNTFSGVLLEGGAGNQGGQFTSNIVKQNMQHGVFIAGSHWAVNNNRIDSNSVQTTNTFDGIFTNTNAADCEILVNKIVEAGGGNAMRYGIHVVNGALRNHVAGNRVLGTLGTANYNLVDASTIQVWAGGTGDNQ